MKIKILTLESDHHFTCGFGVEFEGIRNAWVFKDDIQKDAGAFIKCAEWLQHLSTLSDDEKEILRKRSAA